MNIAHDPALHIKCPHCGHRFVPEHAFEHEMREKLDREYKQKLLSSEQALTERIRREEAERFTLKVKVLEEEKIARQRKMNSLEEQVILLSQRENDLKAREEKMEMEMKKRLLERQEILKKELEVTAMQKAELAFREQELNLKKEKDILALQLQKKMQEEVERAREQERLRQGELQKKLDDQNRLINEMKRKAEQGSMQLQGEVQEIAIEDFLTNAFPRDVISEVSKGKRGGDCIHIVKDNFDRTCGKILYESKRTKHFSNEWIGKLKEDMRQTAADIAVIVTEVLPEGMIRFGEKDGIWICTFSEFKPLSYLFRFNLIRVGELMSSQENRGDKMSLLYQYVTGNEFRQKLEAAFESFNGMQEDLVKEKALFVSQWAKREKRLFRAMENLVCLYGDVRGIAGGAVQEIKALEVPSFDVEYNH